MKSEVLKIELELTESQLGTCPKDKEIYKTYIASKSENAENGKEEVQTIEQIEEKGWTGFHADSDGIFIYDYMVRGFLKAAGNAMKGQMNLKAVASKIDQFVFVFPRRIHVTLDGENVKNPHGIIERPLRAQTMQGPRVTLARSDYLQAKCKYEFEIHVLENDRGITPKVVTSLLEYGKFSGLGQFRNGSYGRFNFKVQK